MRLPRYTPNAFQVACRVAQNDAEMIERITAQVFVEKAASVNHSGRPIV